MTRLRRQLRRPCVLASVGFLSMLLVTALVSQLLAANSSSALGETIRGTRGLVLVAGGVLLVALPFGIVLGTLAGMGSRLADALLARAVELGGAFPSLVLVAALSATELSSPFFSLVLALGALKATEVARLLRGELLRLAAQDFVVAARALGSPLHVVALRQLFPHVLGPVWVSAALVVPGIIALEAALCLFGLTGSSALSSWGAQMADAVAAKRVAGLIWPALASFLTSGSLYIVADALDDSLRAS